MASVGAGSAYATDIIAVQRVYYNQVYNFSYQWFVVMSTQLIGFSLGGVMRRFLVTPPSMIWPVNLVTCALFNTLHSQQYAGIGNRGGISRERFFSYMFLVSFFWCKCHVGDREPGLATYYLAFQISSQDTSVRFTDINCAF